MNSSKKHSQWKVNTINSELNMPCSHLHESVTANVYQFGSVSNQTFYKRGVFCFFFFDVSGGLSPAKMQQMWKELTNRVTEAKGLSEGNQDPCVNDMMSTKAIGRQDGVQQASSQRAEWYDPSVGAAKLIVRTETTLAFSC